MTEKRFYMDKTADLWDKKGDKIIVDFGYSLNWADCKWIIDLLNELNDENEQLKLDKQQLHMAMSREEVRHKQFKDKVFNLINGKIKLYSHKPVSAPISQPMSVNFDEDVDRLARLSELEALKEELLE